MLYKQKARKRLNKTLAYTSCKIERRANTTGPSGAPTGDKYVVAENVRCRLIEGKSDTEDIGEQFNITEAYTLVLALGTDIGVNDIVTIDSNVYNVMDIVTRHSDSSDVQAMIKRERL